MERQQRRQIVRERHRERGNRSARDDEKARPSIQKRRQRPERIAEIRVKAAGLGLHRTRSIVEAHGGKLRAENVDEGARFCFTLPVARKSESQEVA